MFTVLSSFTAFRMTGLQVSQRVQPKIDNEIVKSSLTEKYILLLLREFCSVEAEFSCSNNCTFGGSSIYTLFYELYCYIFVCFLPLPFQNILDLILLFYLLRHVVLPLLESV